MNINVQYVGFEELAAKFANTPARMAMWRTTMDLIGLVIVGSVVPKTPVGVTSILRGSWQSDTMVTPLSAIATVGTPIAYAFPVEHGRQPGSMPPPDALATWVARKLGPDVDPFVVARAIGRRGIPPKKMLERAILETTPTRKAIVSSQIRRLLEDS